MNSASESVSVGLGLRDGAVVSQGRGLALHIDRVSVGLVVVRRPHFLDAEVYFWQCRNSLGGGVSNGLTLLAQGKIDFSPGPITLLWAASDVNPKELFISCFSP